jgi:SAM-dependent methyltransferase
MSDFDQYADKYLETLERPCALSGETPDFYAEGRLRWCRGRLNQMLPIETVLDFGCGIGGSFRHFVDLLGCKTVIGVDPSIESLRKAREQHSGLDLQLALPEEFIPKGDLPFAFCNGVFHHIPPVERQQALAYIRSCLAPGGIFAFWENNPWNPVVVHSMSLNEFDEGAQTISPSAAVRMLKAAGFRIQFLDFCFFFPHFARGLRRFERSLRRLPLGAQYLVVAKK